MFECTQCLSRYHSTCLDGVTEDDVLREGSWTCVKCLSLGAGLKQLSVSSHTLNQLEGQLVAALSDIRKLKGTGTVNTLKRDLSVAREELQESHKRFRSMEKELNEAKAALAGSHENMHLHTQLQSNGIGMEVAER